MIGRKFTDRELQGRADLSWFSPERPLFVGPEVFAAMKREVALADMLDRVRVYAPIPISMR